MDLFEKMTVSLQHSAQISVKDTFVKCDNSTLVFVFKK